jgi:hypothetical protein
MERMKGALAAILGWRGRWIGRRAATVVGSRGIPSLEAQRLLAERSDELHGPMLDGFRRGVSDVRPEWLGALPKGRGPKVESLKQKDS